MTDEFVLPFEKVSKRDVNLAGGKGASLGEMTQAGIPVPPGYIVLAHSFEIFIEETRIREKIEKELDLVDIEDIKTVESASERIKDIILGSDVPRKISDKIMESFDRLGAEFVAVRSSATSEDSSSAAWAGQLETYLNTERNSLIESVRKCWASLFTTRAIFYRFEKGLQKQNISVAVVVQKMVDSEVAGIAFSVHPVTEDKNQILIEGSFGLGEAIVSGQVTPDSYVVDKRNNKIIENQVNFKRKALYKSAKGGNEWVELDDDKAEKQVLNDREIIELAKIISRIEEHYGFPCDIEWAKEKGKFYITQSRPITTLINK